MTERRKHSRLSIQLRASVTFADGTRVQGQIVNISFGGTFLQAAALANTTRREDCRLYLYLGQEDSAVMIKIDSRIVWADANGVGLQFLRIELSDYGHFEKMMLYNSQDPDQLLEELQRHPGLQISEG